MSKANERSKVLEEMSAGNYETADVLNAMADVIVRLRDDLQRQADWADWAKGELDRLTDKLTTACRDRDITHAAMQSFAKDRDRAERILAALREPSETIDAAACDALPYGISIAPGIRAAVAAAEKEVRR